MEIQRMASRIGQEFQRNDVGIPPKLFLVGDLFPAAGA
jgi:hypothetical protein